MEKMITTKTINRIVIKEYGPQLFFADAGKIEEQERSAVKARTDLAPKNGAKMTSQKEA